MNTLTIVFNDGFVTLTKIAVEEYDYNGKIFRSIYGIVSEEERVARIFNHSVKLDSNLGTKQRYEIYGRIPKEVDTGKWIVSV